MKRWKTYLIAIAGFLAMHVTQAQKSGLYWNNLNENSNRLNGKLRGEVYYLSPLANEKFFFQQEWAKAKIELTDGDIVENVDVRYLELGDELVAYNENIRTLFKVEKETVKGFSFKIKNSDTEIKFIRICTDQSKKSCRFYRVLDAGNAKLLAFHFVEEKKVNPYMDKYGLMRDFEYRHVVDYFVFDTGGELKKIQKKRRSLLKSYPENRKEIKKTLAGNKIFIRDENSLIQAFKVLDEANLLKH